MKYLQITILKILFLILLILSGMGVSGHAKSLATIVYTGDLFGNIQPCPT